MQSSRLQYDRLARFTPLLMAVLAAVLYVVTVRPGLMGGDTAEAQFVPYTLSVMHYTGYPLYSIVGYVWSHLVTIGDVAYRMNLLSALCAALAIGILTWFGKAISRKWVGGIAAALMLLCSPLFWDWATKAGVRAMNVAFVLAIFSLAVAWADRQREAGSRSNRYWVALWVMVGLSLAHHRTTLLILPGVALYILLNRASVLRDWRALAMAILSTLPGLALYLYIPWAAAQAPPYLPVPLGNLNEFLDLVLARNLSNLVTSLTLAQVPERLGWFLDALIAQFSVIGVAVAFAGMILLLLRQPKAGMMLWLSLLLLITFTITYIIGGMARLNEVFLLPVYAIASMGAGYCVAEIVRGLNRLARAIKPGLSEIHLWPVSGLVLVAIVVALIPLTQISLSRLKPASEPQMDAYREELRSEQATRLTTYGESYARPGAVIVGEWEQTAAFLYQQIIARRWPGATFRYPLDAALGGYIEEAWAQGREIYLARAVSGLGKSFQLSMAGPLIHISREPATELPASAMPVNQSFAGGFHLQGYYAYTQTFRAGGVLPVSLYWRADEPLRDDYSISVRLVNAQGQQIAQEDATAPVLGSYPTTQWRPGAIVGDYYELRMPNLLAPGTYTLAVVVYQALPDGSTRNLPNATTGAPMTSFGEVNVMPMR